MTTSQTVGQTYRDAFAKVYEQIDSTFYPQQLNRMNTLFENLCSRFDEQDSVIDPLYGRVEDYSFKEAVRVGQRVLDEKIQRNEKIAKKDKAKITALKATLYGTMALAGVFGVALAATGPVSLVALLVFAALFALFGVGAIIGGVVNKYVPIKKRELALQDFKKEHIEPYRDLHGRLDSDAFRNFLDNGRTRNPAFRGLNYEELTTHPEIFTIFLGKEKCDKIDAVLADKRVERNVLRKTVSMSLDEGDTSALQQRVEEHRCLSELEKEIKLLESERQTIHDAHNAHTTELVAKITTSPDSE